MSTFNIMKHCKSSLKICLKCPYTMHSLRSTLCKMFRKHGNFYKAHIAPRMKRCRQPIQYQRVKRLQGAEEGTRYIFDEHL